MSLPEPGDTVLHFNVLEKIGQGGMGVVYRARDTKLDRNVALKFLLAADRDSRTLQLRFSREARAMASLRHPNIVTIHDFDTLDGTPFLVMEWLPGTSLDALIQRGPCSQDEFARLALPIADALAEAHRKGIVHRDVKPSNVLLTEDGEVKLSDFGLAKLTHEGPDLTGPGAMLGTVSYMSPEQARGYDIGPTSDIFSFGVLSHELLAGEHPFRGDPRTLLYRIVNERPEPLGGRRPDLPAALVELLGRCLDNAPEKRPADGGALAAALRDVFPSSDRVPADHSRAETLVSPVPVPDSFSGEQEIRFCRTQDGVGIAYSIVGAGYPLVRVLGWFTHLEMEWEWPQLRYLWERLATRFTVVRYDGRGIGLSDPWEEDFNEETRRLDLETVLKAAGVAPAVLLGISEGGWTAASYALKYPEDVSHLVFYGCYSRGVSARPSYDPEEDAALTTLMRKGWGRRDPAFRQIFTSQFFPSDADPDLITHFNELQRRSADGDTAARYLHSLHTKRGDGRQMFEQLNVPSLVIHQRSERCVSFDEGRRLAALIPGATFKPLAGSDHYFPTDRRSADEVFEAVARFVDDGRSHHT